MVVIFFKEFIHLFLKRWEGREKGKKRNMDVREKHRLVACHTHLKQGLNTQPGMRPDWESNWRPLTLWDDAQLTEPPRPG